VVDRLEVEVRTVPNLAQRGVILLGLAVGGVRVRQVWQGGEQLVALLAELPQLRLELVSLGLERAGGLARLRELRLVRLARLGGLLDLRRELVLLGPDRVDARVELAPPLIDRKQLIELVRRAAPCQRGPRRLRIGADLLQVERGRLPRTTGRRSWCWRAGPAS
jgi:hypothetical protein